MNSTRARALRALLPALLLSLALTGGCSNEDADPSTAPSASDAGSGNDGAGGKGENGSGGGKGDGGGTGDGDGGSQMTTTSTLSPDYPKDDVPLIRGNILQSGVGEDRYTATVLLRGKPEAALDKAIAKLDDAGLVVVRRSGSKRGAVALLRSDDYHVEVSATPQGPQSSVTYVVDEK